MQVLVPDLNGVDTPLPGIEVTALPYNRDSLLAALESRAPSGRPHTRELDTLFQAFRGPFLAFARAAGQVEQTIRVRDSLSARRAALAPDSPARGELELRILRLADSVRRLTPALERARTALGAARDTLWPRIERLQAEIRAWEHSIYAGSDTIHARLLRDRLRFPVSDTTDATGWASLVLPSGRWWILARSPDPQDPNALWYWNLPVSGDSLRLDRATGRHLQRY